jgi:hypothetical protein
VVGLDLGGQGDQGIAASSPATVVAEPLAIITQDSVQAATVPGLWAL